MYKLFTLKNIIVSSGSREMFSIVSLASLVLVSIMAPSIFVTFARKIHFDENKTKS